MRICDLPISFFNDNGKFQVLLAVVGMKVPSVFSILSKNIEKVCSIFDLDCSSWLPASLHLEGTIKFQISTCDTPDALPFLLGLGDDLLPHNDFHVVCGAAVAESQADLIAVSKEFVDTVRKLSPLSVPFLYIFSKGKFKAGDLPSYTTQIPIDQPELIYQCVRERFVMFVMEFIHQREAIIERIIDKTDVASNMLKVASSVWIFGGRDQAIEYFEKALKLKNPRVTSVVLTEALNPNFNVPFDKYTYKYELPEKLQDFEDDPQFTNQVRTALYNAVACKDKLVLVRLLLHLAIRIPKHARLFIVEALAQCNLGKRAQYTQYSYLALLMLCHLGYKRTFLYQTDSYFSTHKNIPSFITKIFVQELKSGSDWLEQRLSPASNIFSKQEVSRDIKSNMVLFLLKYLHTIRVEKQQNLLDMVPSGTKIDASMLLNIEEVKYIIPSQPIEPAAKANRSSVFIFSPLEKRKLQNIASVGDMMSFIVSLRNPLHVDLKLDLVSLTATNGSAIPFSCEIEADGSVQIPLVVSPSVPGEMKITGFHFSTGNILADYQLPQPIIFTIIEELPTLNVCLPFRRYDTINDNSNFEMIYELVNGGDVELELKPIKFAPAPAVLTGTSLPIAYPPKLEPELPEKLLPGTTHRFQLNGTSDLTLTNLSFAIEYGSKDYIRRFEYNHPLSVEPGPKISRVEAIPLDEHDDFEDNQATLLIVIENPMGEPITVSADDVKQTFVKSHSFGTFLVNIMRAAMPADIRSKWTDYGLTAEHVRKCETSAIKALERELTPEEKHSICASLFIKTRIKQQLSLMWKNQHAQWGPLPFNHVELDDKTITLLQPPPFSADFTIKRIESEIWEVTCDVKSDIEHKFKAMLSFYVDNGQVMTAGKSVYELVSPATFSTAVHCDVQAKMSLMAKFFVGEACFIRRVVFDLSLPVISSC